MSDSSDPTAVPDLMDLAKVVKALGGTPRMYLPQNSEQGELFSKAALATAAYGRAAKTAHKAQRDLEDAGAIREAAALNQLLTVAMEEGDDRDEAVPLLWYWQIAGIARTLRDLRERAPQVDPLIKATADAARALMILLEARLNLKAAHADRLTAALAEAEEMLTSARSNTARLPHWLRQPGNLG